MPDGQISRHFAQWLQERTHNLPFPPLYKYLNVERRRRSLRAVWLEQSKPCFGRVSKTLRGLPGDTMGNFSATFQVLPVDIDNSTRDRRS